MKFKDTKYGDLTGQTYYGNIDVSRMGITSLEGSPKIVQGRFLCTDNSLTSLKYGPKEINGIFVCAYNYLTSLEHGPEKVNGNYNCSHNQLNNMKFYPKNVAHVFNVDDNPNPHLWEERNTRETNPNATEAEIMKTMYTYTKDPRYLPDTLRKVFLIKDNK